VEKQYIYVETNEANKKKALRLAKKYDLSLRQLINKLIKDAK